MTILGIDISQKTFDATVIDETGTRRHRQFSNNLTGFQALHTWLKPRPVDELHACMEATNIYWEALADDLARRGAQVSVVNPARTKGFALSQLKRNKTDKVDSGVIADFCQRMTPQRWTPPSPEQRELRDLVRHVDTLKKTRTQQTNRLKACRNPIIQRSFLIILDTLNAQIVDIESQIEAQFTAQPTLKAQRDILESIQGIGPVSSTKLLSEMYDLTQYHDARAAAADAGLTPSHYESGTSVRRTPHLSKMGKASIRGALYWPAITAMQHNPIIRDLKERLEKKGKPTKVIIGAAMRKLLHLAYGVLKHNTIFDPSYVNTSKNIKAKPAYVHCST